MLSPPKPLDEIQPNLVCELLTWIGRTAAHFLAPPLGPWGGAKSSNIITYHKISITMSISKFLKPNFVCLLTNERYKTYQTGFSFGHLRHAPRVGLEGNLGSWGSKKFRNSTRFGVWDTYKNATYNGTIVWVPAPWGLGVGPKGQISLNLYYKVSFKDF